MSSANISDVGNGNVPAYFLTALAEYGVREVMGAGTNPRIAEYLRSCNVPPQGGDETPWCSAFINWVMIRSGMRGTASAAARSWLTWGEKVLIPTVGTVAVLWRDDPKSAKGHVGLWIRRAGTDVWLLSGNQQNQVCISPYPVARILDLRGA